MGRGRREEKGDEGGGRRGEVGKGDKKSALEEEVTGEEIDGRGRMMRRGSEEERGDKKRAREEEVAGEE